MAGPTPATLCPDGHPPPGPLPEGNYQKLKKWHPIVPAPSILTTSLIKLKAQKVELITPVLMSLLTLI